MSSKLCKVSRIQKRKAFIDAHGKKRPNFYWAYYGFRDIWHLQIFFTWNWIFQEAASVRLLKRIVILQSVTQNLRVGADLWGFDRVCGDLQWWEGTRASPCNQVSTAPPPNSAPNDTPLQGSVGWQRLPSLYTAPTAPYTALHPPCKLLSLDGQSLCPLLLLRSADIYGASVNLP